MSFLKKSLILAMAMASTISINASANNDELTLKQINELARQDIPVNSQILPLNKVVVNEFDNKTLIISGNGRYKIEGKIFDSWLGTYVDNYESAKFSSEHIALENIGFKPHMLDPIKIGSGPVEIPVFLNPYQPASRKFIEEAKQLLDEYTFNVIFVQDGNTSLELANAFACVKNPKKLKDAILEGDISKSAELKPRLGCQPHIAQSRIATFVLLGFTKMPAIIAPSSKISQGDRPDGWTEFLKENKS